MDILDLSTRYFLLPIIFTTFAWLEKVTVKRYVVPLLKLKIALLFLPSVGRQYIVPLGLKFKEDVIF